MFSELPGQELLNGMPKDHSRIGAWPTQIATKSSRQDQIAAVPPSPPTRTIDTRRIAAIITKMPAEKMMTRLILRWRVVLTVRMAGAGIAMMQRSVKMFMMRAGSIYISAWGSQFAMYVSFVVNVSS